MKKRKIEVPLQNGKELKPIMIKPNMGRIIKPMAKFPDLSGDGKVTKKDILIGKGVIDKPKMYNKPKNKVKKDTPERLKIKKTGRELQNALIKEKSKPATQQDKRVINQLQGAIEEQKKKLKNPTMKKPKMYKKPKASYNMLSGLGTKKGQRKVKRAAKATARAKKNIDMVKISQTGKITKSGTVSSAKNQSRQGVALRQQKKATRLMGQALKKSTPSRRKAKRQAVKATKAEYAGGRKLGQITKKTAQTN